LIAWVGRYEGAWDNDKYHGHGIYTWASGNRCARHGRGVPGVSLGGAHAQRVGRERGGLGACGRTRLTHRCAEGGTGAGAAGGGVRLGGCGRGDCWQVRGRMGQRNEARPRHLHLGQRKQVHAARARGAWRVSGRRACPAGGSVAGWEHAAGLD
jgi:hypothetical protein